jgi:RimJ/RimL family protein N-acetyltransferase
VTSAWRTLRRIPIAVIQSHGPSIRHLVMFESGVMALARPNRASSSSSRSSTHASAGPRTPNRRSTGLDRRPRRIGNRCVAMRRSLAQPGATSDIVRWMTPAAAIRLRPYTDADRWLTQAIEADPVMMADLGGPLPPDDIAGVHQRRLAGMVADRVWYFVVELEPEGPVVGSICLWSDAVDGGYRSEAGWAILHEFQGRGLATEALRQLVARAAQDGRWGDIHALPGVSNAASNAVCRKGGFKKVGEETVEYAGRRLRCNHWVLETDARRAT